MQRVTTPKAGGAGCRRAALAAGSLRWSVLLLALITCAAGHEEARAETAAQSGQPAQQLRPIQVTTPRPRRVRVRPQSQQRQPAQAPAPLTPVVQGTTPPGRPAGAGDAPPPKAASEMAFTGQEVAERPATRPAEALEVAPGLI